MTVCLARRDREAAGQHRAGKGHHNDVAHLEVVRTTHHAAGTRVVIVRTDIDLAPADRLAVRVGLHLVRQHLADDQRTTDLGPDLVDCFDLQASLDQRFGKGAPIKIIGPRGVLTYPTQGNSHRAVPTSARLKRTSPSIMSRMSSTLFRNINVRSTPIPNAKP